MVVYIDADGCPVVDDAVKLCAKADVKCVIVCNTSHHFNRPPAKTIIVDKGADSADFALVNLLKEGDIVVTQDYGLAAMSLARAAVPISQNGIVYTHDNIDAMLHQRHLSKKIRQTGGKMKGPSKRTTSQDEAFKRTLKNLLDLH